MAKTGKSIDDYGLPIYRRDKWTCQYCGFRGHDPVTFRFLSVDHVVRKADGGPDAPSNLVTACRACNDYFNRRSFSGFEEKREAIRERLELEADAFRRLVEPTLRRPEM